MKTRFASWTLLLAAVVLTFTPAAHAGLAVDLTGTLNVPADFSSGYMDSSPGATIGYKFTLTLPYRITHLGVFDGNGSGLADAHDVGLWTEGGGTLLASVNVPSGISQDSVVSTSVTSSNAILNSKWRFEALGTPLTLNPGDYRIGAWYPQKETLTNVDTDDSYLYGVTSGVVSGTGVTLLTGEYKSVGGSLAYPGGLEFNNNYGQYGPNFQGQAVPEPGSLALIATALAACGGGAWMRRRRQSATASEPAGGPLA